MVTSMLSDRLAELQALDPAPNALKDFLQAIPCLPLFHRLRGPFRSSEPVLEPAGPKSSRTALGTGECVFFSIGVAAYVTPPVVLAFGPMQDVRPGRISAPWDTRGLKVIGCDEENQARLIAEYSIAAPDDEEYLAHYLGRCFDHLHHWLEGRPPTGSDVLGVLEALKRNPGDDVYPMTTPEARYKRAVELPSGLLLAAFADADYPVGRPDEEEWGKTYRILERYLDDRFVRLRRRVGVTDIRSEAYRFVRDHLEGEGLR